MISSWPPLAGAKVLDTHDTTTAPTQPAAGRTQPVEDTYVSVVRNGTMPGYETTTIGKAFEATFQDPKWNSGQTAKGETVVQFDGMLPNPEYTHKIEEYKNCLAEAEGIKKHSYADYVERALRQDTVRVAALEKAAKQAAGYAELTHTLDSLKMYRQLRESQAADSLRLWNDAAGALALQSGRLEKDDYAVLKDDSADAKQFQEFYQTLTTQCDDKNPEGGELVAVEFQWTFKTDGKAFSLSFVKKDPWEHIPGDFWDVSVTGYRDEDHIAQNSLINDGRAYIERRAVAVTERTISTEKVLAFIYH
jgi:hypothetical protein